MIQFCMFGGYDGELRNDRRGYFTLFGGCDLKRPTLARRIMAKQTDHRPKPERRQFLITLFGGTSIFDRPLADEFLELREAVLAGKISLDNWDQHMVSLDEDGADLVTITLFGGMDEGELPGDNKEIDAIALQRHLGNIPDEAGEILQMGIGLADAQRRTIIYQAVAAAVGPS